MMKRLWLALAFGWTAGAGQVGAEEAPRDTPAAAVTDAEFEACRKCAEDEAYAAARRVLPSESLSGEDRIKDLIYQLRDQDGGQFMQPGSCSIFNFGQEQDSPADRLVEIGFAAVPFLIEAMGDDRLTYGVGFHRGFYFSHEVRGIEFEASRAADLGGVEIRIRLIPRERPGDELDQWDGSEDVTLGDEQVHTAGYGGGLSKDDPEDSKELAAGVDKVVAAGPRTPYEIRWELVGWWHDDE